MPKRLRLCTRCPRTHQPSGLSVWIDESGWGGILVEELEPPWAAGTFVADIFAADVPKYSDFFEPNIPDEENFFFVFCGGGKGAGTG